MKNISKTIAYLLITYSVGMLTWGVLGFIEYFTGITILTPLQNPNFPSGTQFIHWTLICSVGFSFLIGYFKRWNYTPNLISTIFAMLATMCAIQTFDFMTAESKYISFVIEVIMYILISLFMFRSKYMQSHFNN